jgi:hypothetical protein
VGTFPLGRNSGFADAAQNRQLIGRYGFLTFSAQNSAPVAWSARRWPKSTCMAMNWYPYQIRIINTMTWPASRSRNSARPAPTWRSKSDIIVRPPALRPI